MIFISHSLISEFAEIDRAKEEVGAASTKKGKCNLKKKVSWLKLISAKVSNNLLFRAHEGQYLLIFLFTDMKTNSLCTKFIVSILTRLCLQCSNTNRFIPLGP